MERLPSESDNPVRRERDILAAIVNSSLGAIVSIDPDGVVLSWNLGAERLFGYPAEEAIGRRASFLAPPHLQHESGRLMQRLLDGEEIVDFETVRQTKGGDLIDVVLTASVVRDENGGLVGLAAVYHDVTAKKAARSELARRERQLNDAQRIANLGSWELDVPSGRVEWSDQMYRILGYEPGEIELTWDAVAGMVSRSDEQRFREAVARAVAQTGEFEIEIEAVRKDGSITHLQTRGHRLEVTAGGPRLSGVALDVTERKRLEDQLMQSQKMEALGGLAGGIAHDFNNLLAVILNYGRFIEEELPPGHQAREDIREMIAAGERGADLVRQLLSFARREVVRPEPINLNLLVRQMRSLLTRAVPADVTLDMTLTPGLWNTEADGGQIEQLLLNLVVNARDAMPTGGRITIETRNVVADETMVTTRPNMEPGRYVALIVSDTGSGMDKETQNRIFEPFFTTKPRGSGTGLGLASVYGIVTRAGGDISVYSEVGLGTTFKIFLPVSTLQVQIGGMESDDRSVRGGSGERIVVVEDEEPVLELITRILSESGYETVPLTSANEALELLRGEDRVDLLLTDVIMPEMTGRSLSEAADLPTIFMSGYTNSIIEQQGVLQQGVLFLPKPFSQDELLRIVRSTLDARMHLAADHRSTSV